MTTVTHTFDCPWPHGGSCRCDYIQRRYGEERGTD